MTFFFNTLLSFTLFLILIKRLYKIKFGTTDCLCLKDIYLLLIISFIISFFEVIELPILSLLLYLTISTILWVDSLLMYCFGMKITIHNIKTFSQGVTTFKGESIDIILLLKRYPWIISCFLFSISSSYITHMNNTIVSSLTLVFLLFSLSKSKIKHQKDIIIWLFCFILINYLNETIYISKSESIIISALILFIICIYSIIKNRSEFIRLPSILSSLLIGTTLGKGEVTIKTESILKNIVNNNNNNNNISNNHSCCHNNNILLFTVESMSSEAFNDSPLSNKLLSLIQNKIEVENFYSISPNTNQSISQIYTSTYGKNNNYLNLNKLLKNGYSTSFITTQNTLFFNMNETLKKSGFENIIDINEIGNNNIKSDYLLYENIHLIKEKLKNGKAFIQILNDQTHSKYNVYNKNKFNRYNNNNDKGRYLNAIDESLSIIYDIILDLKNNNLLENTILCITGDHGQSFGEEGYYTHSSSTINQQVKIPLIISNSKIDFIEKKQGCLLDLLPTLFDFIGITLDLTNKDGINLTSQQRNFLLLYSDTRSANSPSNISIIIEDKKYYIDLISNKITILNLDDTEYRDKNLTKKEILHLIYSISKNNNILN